MKRIEHYNLIAELKRGSNASVYRGYDEHERRFVLVKVLHAADTGMRDRFQQEARILESLRHPNIVRIIDFGEEKTTCRPKLFLVTEFVEGRNLAEIMRPRPLPPEIAIYIVREILQALQWAHRRYIIHRDIKPQNVLIDTGGNVKVTDFGLAEIMGTACDPAGSIIGTPQYMSPEQARGERATPTSDLFSLGAMLYEMLSGISPFEGESISDCLYRVTHENPAPLSAIAAEAPAPLATFVHCLLQKDPAHRPLDAGRALKELHRGEAQYGAKLSADRLQRYVSSPSEYAALPILSQKKKPSRATTIMRTAAVAIIAVAAFSGLWRISGFQADDAISTPPLSKEMSDSAGNQIRPSFANGDSAGHLSATLENELPLRTETADLISAGENIPAETQVDTRGNAVALTATSHEGLRREEVNEDSATSPSNHSNVEVDAVNPLLPGLLQITCMPMAYAVLDSDTLGMVDFALANFHAPPGTHTLELINPRFPIHSRRVHLEGGDTARITISLWETVGVLKLNVRPWAEVTIDSVDYGKTPLDEIILAPGEYRIALSHPEREPFTTLRTVAAGRRDTLNIELQPINNR